MPDVSLEDVLRHEPDEVTFEHAGLVCIAARNSMSGAWCGYVGVSSLHTWYKVDYLQIAYEIDVHGGLTFSGNYPGVVRGVYPTGLWWFGFDCAHAGDYCPRLKMINPDYNTYRDINYVREELKKLAEQLARGSSK